MRSTVCERDGAQFLVGQVAVGRDDLLDGLVDRRISGCQPVDRALPDILLGPVRVGRVLLARLDRGLGLAGRLAFPCGDFFLDPRAHVVVASLKRRCSLRVFRLVEVAARLLKLVIQLG
jgi:hypothetical protein